jgi:hypothetical protein
MVERQIGTSEAFSELIGFAETHKEICIPDRKRALEEIRKIESERPQTSEPDAQVQ